jgi:hypothetical protein
MNVIVPNTLYPIFYCNSLLMKDTICLLQCDHFYARIKAAHDTLIQFTA